jgi:hypothetical protein
MKHSEDIINTRRHRPAVAVNELKPYFEKRNNKLFLLYLESIARFWCIDFTLKPYCEAILESFIIVLPSRCSVGMEYLNLFKYLGIVMR